MPLLSFSEPEHIKSLLSGKKIQTTRLKRKNPLKVGDTLYCYYKPRQQKGCPNCISNACKITFEQRASKDLRNYPSCDYWSNYFGEATITKIFTFDKVIKANELEFWAELDGFEDYKSANLWFNNQYGVGWQSLPLEVITFKPEWVMHA